MNEFDCEPGSAKADDGINCKYYLLKYAIEEADSETIEEADSETIEVFAKALFSIIYEKYSKKYDKKLRIAILFKGSKEQSKWRINEFVRLFSVFYLKTEVSEKEYMADVQIALLSESENNSYEVNFIIAGKDFATAYQTACDFVYYNADSSLPFIPLLRFLKNGQDKISEGKKVISLFPFDLFIENGDFDEKNADGSGASEADIT